jgi:hypothetical protein
MEEKMASVDLKKTHKTLFSPPREPVMVDVPELAFLMVDGSGDPNGPGFGDAIQALYGASYTLKFQVKKEAPELDYGVAPLEGLWWVPGGLSDPRNGDVVIDKEKFEWTAMIMQPEVVTGERLERAVAELLRKKGNDAPAALARVRLERFAEGRSAQVMHFGPYADEGPTIQRLHEFIAERGCRPHGRHHEIYLGDPRRCAPEKLRTVVRQPVEPA